jgi:hypothetical protein
MKKKKEENAPRLPMWVTHIALPLIAGMAIAVAAVAVAAMLS